MQRSYCSAYGLQYGMSDKLGMVTLSQQQSRYLGEVALPSHLSEATAEEIDAELGVLLKRAISVHFERLKEG